MDKPKTHIRLGGINKIVSKTMVNLFMSRYGNVSSVYRKRIHRDMVDGTPGFIWDGNCQVHLIVNDGLVLQTLILAPRSIWRLKHQDSRFLCFKCVSANRT